MRGAESFKAFKDMVEWCARKAKFPRLLCICFRSPRAAPAPDAHRSLGERAGSMDSIIFSLPTTTRYFHATQNPITRFSLFAFRECSSIAARTFPISRSSIVCVTFYFAGS